MSIVCGQKTLQSYENNPFGEQKWEKTAKMAYIVPCYSGLEPKNF